MIRRSTEFPEPRANATDPRSTFYFLRVFWRVMGSILFRRLPFIRTMTSLGPFKQAPHKFVPLDLSLAYLLTHLISRLLL